MSDSEVKFYLDKFRKEEENLSEATRKRMEWSDKENRHQANMKSALQLLTDRALEIGESLPEDLLKKGSSILGTSVYQDFQNRKLIRSAAIQQGLPLPIQLPTAPEAANAPREINRVEWITAVVQEYSPKGMTPPEIMKLAATDGITMHENYPYVVLKKLVKKGIIIREGARYRTA
jgi:hypothetical protein